MSIYISIQVAKIKYEQNLMEQESKQKMASIENEIHLAKERSRADAEFYKVHHIYIIFQSLYISI